MSSYRSSHSSRRGAGGLTDEQIFTPPYPGLLLETDGYWHRRNYEMDAPQIDPPHFPAAYLPFEGYVQFPAWEMFRGSGREFPIAPDARGMISDGGLMSGRGSVTLGYESLAGRSSYGGSMSLPGSGTGSMRLGSRSGGSSYGGSTTLRASQRSRSRFDVGSSRSGMSGSRGEGPLNDSYARMAAQILADVAAGGPIAVVRMNLDGSLSRDTNISFQEFEFWRDQWTMGFDEYGWPIFRSGSARDGLGSASQVSSRSTGREGLPIWGSSGRGGGSSYGGGSQYSGGSRRDDARSQASYRSVRPEDSTSNSSTARSGHGSSRHHGGREREPGSRHDRLALLDRSMGSGCHSRCSHRSGSRSGTRSSRR